MGFSNKQKNKLDTFIDNSSRRLKILIKQDWFIILLLILVSRFLLVIAGDIGYTWMEESPADVVKQHLTDNKYLDMWYRWDAPIYHQIANEGYVHGPAEYAFFPLFPLLLNILSKITGEFLLTGILFSNVLLYFALLFFVKLIRKDFPDLIAKRSMFLVLFFPSTLFLSIAYSESLFLLLSVLGFYFLREKKFWAAGIMGIFLSAARPIGVFFVVGALLYYWIKHRKEWKTFNWLFLLMSPLGLFAYMIFLKVVNGNPFAFIVAQESFGRSISIGTTEHFIKLFSVFTDFSLGNIVNLSFFVLAFIAIVWCWFKWDKSIALFSFFIIFAPLGTGHSLSINRYVLVVLPIYVFLANLGKHPIAEKIILVSCGTLMTIWVMLFVNWYWLA